MVAHYQNKAWAQWDLESTSKLLSKRFPSSFIWVVKSSRLHLGTYACYNNFVETSVFGVPDHNTNVAALPHLRWLLDSAVRKGAMLRLNTIIHQMFYSTFITDEVYEPIVIRPLHSYIPVRAVTRAIIGRVHTHTFAFCPMDFF